MALKAKELNFKTIEITPGIGQINVFKLSGQKELPVLKNGDHVISDSSEIIKYLETLKSEPELFPKEPKEAAIAHIFENWSDTTLAQAARNELIKSISTNPNLRKALLPEELPSSIKGLIENIPCEFITGFNEILNPGESNALLASLEKLSNFFISHEWLVGDSLSIADISLAAQLSLLRFPLSSGEDLKGQGCLGFANNPNLETLFQWRDQLDYKLMESKPEIL